jgi:hypothetical protein
MIIDIVIPILSAAGTFAQAQSTVSVTCGIWLCRVVFCDGASRDDTASIAHTLGALVTSIPPGRSRHLAAGEVRKGECRLFLRTNTVLWPGWVTAAGEFMASPAAGDYAGYFRPRFDLDSPRGLFKGVR